MVAEAFRIPGGQLVLDQGHSTVDLTAQQQVGADEILADDAGKVWLRLVLGEEGGVRVILVGVRVEDPVGQHQAGALDTGQGLFQVLAVVSKSRGPGSASLHIV